MSDIAIRVDGLGKQYRLGGQQEGYRTIREAMTNAFVSPFRRARRLLRGQAYGAAELDETIWALKEVSFEIKRGEVVGIIGGNGAGKTTLLKILSRITEPTEGYAEIRGRVGSLLEVGTGFHSELTGRENIHLNGAILGMRKAEIERRFDDIVDFAEIEKFIDTPVKHYSSGMYVRLAFAVAAHLEPEILLVDEVLAVGDAAFQKKCLGKMGDVAKEGRTVLLVSHNMTAINKLCESAIWLESGSVRMYGDPTTAIQNYLAAGTESQAAMSFANDLSKTAQITSIELLDSRNERSSQFDVLTPICVRITYRAHGFLQNHRIGVCVSSGSGVEVFVTNSSDWQQTFTKLQPGDYVATLLIPNKFLAPGRYNLSVYLGEPNVETHDNLENVLSFAVSGSPFHLPEKRRGLLVYPFKWETEILTNWREQDT